MADYAISTENLKKTYTMGTVKVPALRGIDVAVRKGEFVSIMGPSGSGKTTLLEVIGMLLSPTSGKVMVNNTDVSEMDEGRKADFRLRNIGFVFQFFNLFMDLTALENVMLPKMMTGFSAGECRERAADLLRLVGLVDRTNHRPSELSGGQQQRVTMARALVNSPSILLADEPTGNLDSKSSLEIMELFRRLNEEQGQTIVMVTHEKELGKRADRIIWLKDGLVGKLPSG